jgi:ABC-type phosphate transport system substrate-binding protein
MAFPRYQQQHPGVAISYSAVGSSAGITAFTAGQVNFGASDVPASPADLAGARGGTALRVPVDLGAVVVAYNLPLPGGPHRLRLTGPVIAWIFLGQITAIQNQAGTTSSRLSHAARTRPNRSAGADLIRRWQRVAGCR